MITCQDFDFFSEVALILSSFFRACIDSQDLLPLAFLLCGFTITRMHARASRLDLVPPPSPAVIASGCPVSYRTPLINSLLQRLSSLFASKSPFQRQGPLNIPELALYPTACQLTTTSMAQWPPCRPQPSSELSTTPSWGHPSQKTC